MCSRPFRPFGFPIYVARLPTAPFARCFTLITRTTPCLRQLPSCVAVYPRDCNSFGSHLTRRYPSRLCLLCRFPQKLHSLDRDVFYLAHPARSIDPFYFLIETRSLPTLTRSYPRRFTFYVADPVSSIHPSCFILLNLNSLAARPRSLLPSQLYLLCRSSRSLHSSFLLLNSYFLLS